MVEQKFDVCGDKPMLTLDGPLVYILGQSFVVESAHMFARPILR